MAGRYRMIVPVAVRRIRSEWGDGVVDLSDSAVALVFSRTAVLIDSR